MTGEKTLSAAAARALAEAEARRSEGAAHKIDPDALPRERGGREGPEPVRYGDWEKNGVVSDF